MAHLRPQTSRQTRRNHTLPTRRRLEQTQPSPKSRNKPQKDSRIQTGQAIHCEHKSSKNSRTQRKTPPITLKALYKKARIHNLTPPPLSRQKPLSPRANTIHNVLGPPPPHAPHQIQNTITTHITPPNSTNTRAPTPIKGQPHLGSWLWRVVCVWRMCSDSYSRNQNPFVGLWFLSFNHRLDWSLL